ncbi:MAG: hypothetical protein LBT95_07210 [Treponema sp.]|jgi:hypothetical protein|nr:hypothetical protein [Treponema sp.]
MSKTSKTTKTGAQKRLQGKNRIGTERESSLHRALKFRYAGPEGKTEIAAGGYVCDGISGSGEFIEVQTGSFGPLKQKIRELAELGHIRIIHPIIIRKDIEIFDAEGNLQYRRKSPHKGTEWDLFKALLYAPELPLVPNLIIELALVDIVERRIQDGRGSWRRKGLSIADKVLETCHASLPLMSPEDYHRFIPFEAEEQFTARELGKRARIKTDIAQKTLYVLTRINLVERAGKRGNAWVYTYKQEPPRLSPKTRAQKNRLSQAAL